MILLIGPCMFFAPLVVLLIPVALVLWPPALLLTGTAYLLVWPFAALARRRGGGRLPAMHSTLGAWFRTLLTPWSYFDMPPEERPDEPPIA